MSYFVNFFSLKLFLKEYYLACIQHDILYIDIQYKYEKILVLFRIRVGDPGRYPKTQKALRFEYIYMIYF